MKRTEPTEKEVKAAAKVLWDQTAWPCPDDIARDMLRAALQVRPR